MSIYNLHQYIQSAVSRDGITRDVVLGRQSYSASQLCGVEFLALRCARAQGESPSTNLISALIAGPESVLTLSDSGLDHVLQTRSRWGIMSFSSCQFEMAWV